MNRGAATHIKEFGSIEESIMKDKQVLRLKWRGPWKFTDGKSDIAPKKDVPGVYLWVVGGPHKRHVSYVGQSKNLRQRFYDHMISILGGGYFLYKPEALTDVLPVRIRRTSHISPNQMSGTQIS